MFKHCRFKALTISNGPTSHSITPDGVRWFVNHLSHIGQSILCEQSLRHSIILQSNNRTNVFVPSIVKIFRGNTMTQSNVHRYEFFH